MQDKGFIAGLFDLSFSNFITTKVIKVLYVLAILWAGLVSLGILYSGLTSGVFVGILGGLVGAPLIFFIMLLGARIWLELVIVLFRIAENIQSLASTPRQ